MASIRSEVSSIVYGDGRKDVHKMYFEACPFDTLNSVAKAYRDDLTIQGAFLRD